MGYSGRYHAASLAAVFLALAVGILIGVGFGSDIVSGTADSLEQSLGSDLDDAREEVDRLEAELERERDLTAHLYPAIAGERLIGQRIAIIAVGGLPEEISSAVDAALDPTGATLGQIAVISIPPNAAGAADALLGPALSDELRRGEGLERVGLRAGRALVSGEGRFDDVRRSLLSRYSGAPGFFSGAVLVRQIPDDLSDEDGESVARLEAGLIEGMRSSGTTVVGVERSTEESSAISVFNEHGIASVDNVDMLAGQVALVFALDGAGGAFGVKETADRLLPDLLPPAAGSVPGS
ncbi:MAG TPA: copper transporter [Solirubrobacterales bacterium]|nr:copper transporter [Solirubrobacterales bacterium]